MGLNLVAVDVGEKRPAFARKLGASFTVNGFADCVRTGSRHDQAGLDHGAEWSPSGRLPVSSFDVVLNGTTIRGSIVGTRLDLIVSLKFASAGKVKAIVKAEPLENINDIFDGMHKGTIENLCEVLVGL